MNTQTNTNVKCQNRFQNNRDLSRHNCERVTKLREIMNRRQALLQSSVVSSAVSEVENEVHQKKEPEKETDPKQQVPPTTGEDWSTTDTESDCLIDTPEEEQINKIEEIPEQMNYQQNSADVSDKGWSPFDEESDILMDNTEDIDKSSSVNEHLKLANESRPVVENPAMEPGTEKDAVAPRFKCPDCPKTYGKKNSLAIHRNEHTDKFKCPKCEVRCVSNYKLQRHTCDISRNVTVDTPVPEVLESEEKGCQEEEVEDDTYLDDIEMLSCDVCDKYFATQESLNKHSLECKDSSANDVDVNVLQQSYPGISIIPKSMMKN